MYDFENIYKTFKEQQNNVKNQETGEQIPLYSYQLRHRLSLNPLERCLIKPFKLFTHISNSFLNIFL